MAKVTGGVYVDQAVPGPPGEKGMPPFINYSTGTWWEWIPHQDQYGDTGVRAEGPAGPRGPEGPVGPKGDDGTNYLILGWWDSLVKYQLSNAGIPVVKVADGTAQGFSVYSLKISLTSTQVGKKPGDSSWTWSTYWKLETSVEFAYMQNAYIERLQANLVTAEMIQSLLIKTANLEVLNGAKIASFNVYADRIATWDGISPLRPFGTHFVFGKDKIGIYYGKSTPPQMFKSAEITIDSVMVERVDMGTGITTKMEIKHDGIYRNGSKIL